MKKSGLQIVFLIISIILSLFLSYILIFDNNYLLSNLRPEQEAAQVNIQNDSEFSVSDYYKLSNVKLSEVIYPINVIISQNQQAYLLNDYETLKTLATYLSQRRMTLSGDVIETNEMDYLELITQERVEFVFSSTIPYQLASHFLKYSGDDIEFSFNRIIIGKNNANIYLVNAMNQTYMEAKMPDGVSFLEFQSIVNTAKTQWIEAERYALSNGNHVYLPLKNMTVSSEVYTLNQVPENNITQSLFGNGRTWRYVLTNQENNESSISFKNSNIDMQINTRNLMVKVNYTNSTLYEAKTYVERIEQSFNQMRQFEYWTQGIRYGSQSNNVVSVYQRYLNGYPIFSTSSLSHYASTRVLFKGGNLSSSILQVSMPIIYLEAHLPDLSQNYELMNVSELVYLLSLEGFAIDDFANIVIGYEWQPNMENFQKVTLVPRWFLEKNNNYYSLDQIQKGVLSPNDDLNVQNQEEIEEGGDE